MRWAAGWSSEAGGEVTGEGASIITLCYVNLLGTPLLLGLSSGGKSLALKFDKWLTGKKVMSLPTL